LFNGCCPLRAIMRPVIGEWRENKSKGNMETKVKNRESAFHEKKTPCHVKKRGSELQSNQ